MDIFLSKVTQQAMNYAIRSGVTITASYAIRQSARLLKNVEGRDREELMGLQNRLQSKIRILSPAIDMIDLISARGNTSLESAVSLTKSLRFEIQQLGQRLEKAAAAEEKARQTTKAKIQNDLEIKSIINDIKTLLSRIEDAVPMINLAITTSGASLSTRLPATVSPSRLLQASTFLTAGDTQYSMAPDQAVQIGPTFVLSLYMLFAGYARPQSHEDFRETAWKEVMHKARVKLRRVPMKSAFESTDSQQCLPNGDYGVGHIAAEARSDEFAYQMQLIEDLDDDRVHTFEDNEAQPGSYEDVELAGIREILPIHQISKIFYADTGKVLNIGTDGETNNPVLLLKRDPDAIPPRRMFEQETEAVPWEDAANVEGQNERSKQGTTFRGPWSLPPGLDPEWFAFEVFTEAQDTEDEEDEADSTDSPSRSRQQSRSASADPQLTASMSSLHINGRPSADSISKKDPAQDPTTAQPPPWANSIRTSLSLMEMLVRLTSLQQFQQQSHLSITDELLNFFLEESSHTGAGGDEEHRQRLRADARRRVGWDPYDESPMKRHGEEYQYQGANVSHSPGAWDRDGGTSYYTNDEESPYFLRSRSGTPGSPSPSIRAQPRPPIAQTRSMTNTSSSPTQQSPEVIRPKGGRATHLRRQVDERKSSPLRPQTAMTDEGLGTSPGGESQKED